MARMGPAGKARRVLDFLLGLRDDRVLTALSASGFGVADRERGWALLHTLGMTQAVDVGTATPNPAAEALDAWQKQWLRIARVSVERSHPQIHDQLFRGLHVGEPSIAVVTAFLTRFTKLESARDGGSRSALEKLRSRGLSKERVEEGRRLLADSMRPVQPRRSDPEDRRRAIRTAELALWDYYLEWSRLARAVIRDPRLLGLLGYWSSRNPEDDVDEPKAVPNADEPRSRRKQREQNSRRRQRQTADARRKQRETADARRTNPKSK